MVYAPSPGVHTDDVCTPHTHLHTYRYMFASVCGLRKVLLLRAYSPFSIPLLHPSPLKQRWQKSRGREVSSPIKRKGREKKERSSPGWTFSPPGSYVCMTARARFYPRLPPVSHIQEEKEKRKSREEKSRRKRSSSY